MSARYVPAELLRTVLEEMEKDCTVERYHEWYRAQIAAEIRQRVPQPKADKWDVFGNRTITYRFNEACTRLIRDAWTNHREVVRGRIEATISAYDVQRDAKYGDELIQLAGGSTAEMVTWMLKQIHAGQCPCSFQRRAEERKQKHETAKALLSGESFAQWVGEQIDELAKDEQVVLTA